MTHAHLVPAFSDDYQHIFIDFLKQQESALTLIAGNAIAQDHLQMDVTRMLQFVILEVCCGVFGLSPGATHRLIMDAPIHSLHDFIAQQDAWGFPGRSTYLQRSFLLRMVFAGPILDQVKIVLEAQLRIGQQARDLFRAGMTDLNVIVNPEISLIHFFYLNLENNVRQFGHKLLASA
jgi:hypothetical protein